MIPEFGSTICDQLQIFYLHKCRKYWHFNDFTPTNFKKNFSFTDPISIWKWKFYEFLQFLVFRKTFKEFWNSIFFAFSGKTEYLVFQGKIWKSRLSIKSMEFGNQFILCILLNPQSEGDRYDYKGYKTKENAIDHIRSKRKKK